MSTATVVIDSWHRAQQLLYDGSWSEPLGRHRSSLCCRGRGSLERSWWTSLQAAGAAATGRERHLLRSFRKYAYQALASGHDSPTRLLDWSYSPLVALHFATADARTWDVDGAVWCVDYVAAKQALPPDLRRLLEEDGADVFTPELLARAEDRGPGRSTTRTRP